MHVVGPVQAGQAYQCPGAVTVLADDRRHAPIVCGAVESAREVTAACGLGQTRPVTVEIVAEMDVDHEVCAAYFDCETERLTVLSPEALAASAPVLPVFERLPAETYFQSVIVHELTHAFLSQTFGDDFPRLSHEYLAYAFQIESLSESARADILSDVDVDEPVGLNRLSEAVLLFSPSEFALRSYLHFARPENGCAFVKRIAEADPTLPTAFRLNRSGLIP